MAENRVGSRIPNIFLTSMFDPIEQLVMIWIGMEESEIEIIVDGGIAFFDWNNEVIQRLAEELGEPEFPDPRPCG